MKNGTNIKKLSIILLTSSYPSFSGMNYRNFLTDLAECLTKREINIFIICPHQSNLPFREKHANITIIRFPYWFTSSGEKLGEAGGIVPAIGRSLFAMIQLIPFFICQVFVTLKTIKYEKIDIIHSHWIIPQGLVGVIVKLLTGIPHVASIHGTDIHLIHSCKITYPLMKIIAKYSDYITTNSRHTHRLLEEIIPYKNTNSCIIPMGIFPNQFRNKTTILNKPEKSVLFIGRLIALKGVKYLINAMKNLIYINKNVKLIIIGDGPDKTQLELLSRELGISNHIQFLPFLKREQLYKYYTNADVFVLPSVTINDQSEGLGVVLLEAMASEVPVIGSNTGGIPDIIEDGVNGLIVPPGDPQALADAIIRIIENPDLADLFRKAGLKTVETRFSWDVISKQFIMIYRKLMKDS